MIKLVNLEKLKAHERVGKNRLAEAKKIISSNRFFTKPIVVEKEHLIILDGHHRAEALKDLGYRKIPAYLVDYADKKIKVSSRRRGRIINKNLIIKRALSGQLYPFRTSRHLILNRPKNFKIKLSKLK
ncbi:MAG: hypothetical protein A2744_00230 [Candidatus Buchananbacteria bacterium RIFCSPHIGHO2_01_FULL_44_11]|uniref:ParB-like N-terminal domain-containing protein n=1 Tax=Candidatus Buchananbacteria bacterium RIFCSPHIGHO2_01_FULL_44_11 TaxID=1797535 RepID=A0A1G1Y0S5_9BACT|nr:MAG: hypothetical protein A2744_00230 [Candidatus Buchananbacteria bacterium RIFCSPHIGHO2_01_FULL_44_11]